MYREISGFLKMNDVEYKGNYNLSEISPIRIGPKASVVAYPNNVDKLIKLVKFLDEIKIKYKITGRMSNTLFCGDEYEGVIIRTDRIDGYTVSHNVVSVNCGAALPYISNVMCKFSLSGLEGLSGIPGSIGGAIVGNAGAFGSEIADRVVDITCYDKESREVVIFLARDADFSYRHSIFKACNLLVLSARLALVRGDSLSIKNEMDRVRKIRTETQPVGQPSLGSTFKRPGENLYAARLIDECGLKGFSIGGAQISKKHAGFIVNIGGATAKDYIDLSDYAKERVLDKFGVRLEREIEII